MSTVILKWNPGFSSYTMVRFLKDLEKCAVSNDGDACMNWSIFEHEKVHEGDTCYLLKVGYGQTGIVARGTITSEPYSGEDWSWRNRPTMYCDFRFEVMINPDAYPLLDSGTLAQSISDFDWKGGHSGMVLPPCEADILEQLWNGYMHRQQEYFDKASDQNLFMETRIPIGDDLPYSLELDDDYRGRCVKIKFNAGEVTSDLTIGNYDRILGKFGTPSWRAFRKMMLAKYPSAEALAALCGELFRNRIEFEADFYRHGENQTD